MFDYGTARHAQKRRVRKSNNSHFKQSNTQSVVTGLVARLRFFVGSILLFVCSVYLLLIFIVPSIVPLKQPIHIVATRNTNSQQSFYFVHLNPTASLNYSATLPADEPLNVPLLDKEISLQGISQEKPELAKTLYSHMLGVLVNKVVLLPDTFSKDIQTSSDIFSLSLDHKVQLPLKERALLLYYFLISRKNSVAIKELATVATLETQLSDNQAIWEYNTAQACPIAVVNTTTTQGLAQSYSNLLEKSGAFIIRVTSESALKDKSILYSTENKACDGLIRGIQEFFPHRLEIVQDTAKTQEYRSGLVLFLGKDAYTL